MQRHTTLVTRGHAVHEQLVVDVRRLHALLVHDLLDRFLNLCQGLVAILKELALKDFHDHTMLWVVMNRRSLVLLPAQQQDFNVIVSEEFDSIIHVRAECNFLHDLLGLESLD